MLTDEQRAALLLAMHSSIEEAATKAASELMGSSPPDLVYPPNCGLTADEERALAQLSATPALESALRKVIADAAAHPLFDFLKLIDGVGDTEHYSGRWLGLRLHPVPEEDDGEDEVSFLASEFGDTYWLWREKRPNPGWRLDTHEADDT